MSDKQCPKCRDVVLLPISMAEPRSPYHACPRCCGTWLEVQQVPTAFGNVVGREPVPRFAFEAKETVCPSCKVHLFEYCFPATDVLIDGCKQCLGMWLDREEGGRIQQALRSRPQMICPKCHVQQAKADACAYCGVIPKRYLEGPLFAVSESAATSDDLSAAFANAMAFRISQRVAWLEVLSPFELTNRYEVMIQGRGNVFGEVRELSRSLWNFIGRQCLGYLRSAHFEFKSSTGAMLLTMNKPFRFYFHEIQVLDADGSPIGSVERRFHLFRSNYQLRDRYRRILIHIKGPWFFLPFVDSSFRFLKGDQEVGRVSKRWRGLLREYFTDSDAFQADIDASLPLADKLLLFAAVFLIDFGNFENNEGGGISDFLPGD